MPEIKREKALLGLCMNRWAQRITAWSRFLQVLIVIIRTLQTFCGFWKYDASWAVPNDANTTSKAGVLLNSLITPSFIIGLVTFVTIMDPMTILTEKLQGREEDILSAYNLLSEVQLQYSDMCENVDVHFGQIWERSSNIMEELDIDIKVPRIAGRQTMRANVPYSTAEEYYKRALAIPLLDAIQQQLKERFTKSSISASKLLGLDPKCMVTKTSEEMISSLSAAVNLYANDFSEYETKY